jgi:hypothetical protein
MGQLESLRELSIAQPQKKKKKKKTKSKKKKKRKRPLMRILVNFEVLSHYTLEII